MGVRFCGKGSRICVAVKFDEPGRHAVEIAEQFCMRSGAEMRLVHVCEDNVGSSIVSGSFGLSFNVSAEMLQAVQDGSVADAEKKMKAVVQSIKPSIRVTTKILRPSVMTPADLIEAEALSSQCNMIIVGANPGNHRFIPRGFSCALTLMGKANVPVMVTNSNQTHDLKSDFLTLIVADDLRGQDNGAIAGSFDLAEALRKTNIYHVHINGITADLIKISLENALSTSHSHPEPEFSVHEIYSAMINQLENRLENRAALLKKNALSNECVYNKELLTENSVTDCLERYASRKNAHLVVFGRHQTFHHRPFDIGQMPYYSMLNLKCPIIVFPPANS